MSDLILNDVPEEVIEALARRAAEHGRTVEAEHVIILEEALGLKGASFWRRAAALREETRGRILTPSEHLIRQDRDER
jgi:plasmid stability protein